MLDVAHSSKNETEIYFCPTGSERMDYVIDYEDIITNNYTVSIEQFTIPGEGLFIATANNDDHRKNHSNIFKWDGKKFKMFQSVKTHSAVMWKFFQIDYVVRYKSISYEV